MVIACLVDADEATSGNGHDGYPMWISVNLNRRAIALRPTFQCRSSSFLMAVLGPLAEGSRGITRGQILSQ